MSSSNNETDKMRNDIKVTFPKNYIEDIKKNKRQRVYDCFPFFNELDLFEIRLKELCPHVDYFVLAEARQKHSGDSKPLYFEENKKRFSEWADKIIHVVVDLPEFDKLDKLFLKMKSKGKGDILLKMAGFGRGSGRWHLEHSQRKSIINGLSHAQADDVIIVSDIDEIWNGARKMKIIKEIKNHNIVKLEIRAHFFYLNGLSDRKGWGPKACTLKFLKTKLRSNPHYIRSPKDSFLGRFGFIPEPFLILNAGWHFSYLGGIDKIKEKLSSYGHVEQDNDENKNEENIKNMIEEGRFFGKSDTKVRYIKIDQSFPKEIYENQKKYKKYIRNIHEK